MRHRRDAQQIQPEERLRRGQWNRRSAMASEKVTAKQRKPGDATAAERTSEGGEISFYRSKWCERHHYCPGGAVVFSHLTANYTDAQIVRMKARKFLHLVTVVVFAFVIQVPLCLAQQAVILIPGRIQRTSIQFPQKL